MFKKKQGLNRVLTKITAMALVMAMVFPAFLGSVAEAAKTPKLTATKTTNIYVGKKLNINVKNKIKGSKYTWASSDKKVATVNKKNGVVTGVKAGNATITCKVTAPEKTYTLTAKVKIVQGATDLTIKNKAKAKKMVVGDTRNLKTTIAPKKVNDAITWSSADKSIVKVNKNGKITALKAGKAKITAKTASGKKASVTVNVKDTIVVATSGELNAALLRKNISDIRQITIKTDAAATFNIAAGTYTNTILVVKAPNADVVNSAVFKRIRIDEIKATTWTEKAKGNNFNLRAPNGRLVIAEGAEVNNIALRGKAFDIEVNGSVTGTLRFVAATELKLSGKTAGTIKIIIEITAKGAKLETSIKIDLVMNADADLTLNPGSEGSKIDKASNDIKDNIKNNTNDKSMDNATVGGKETPGSSNDDPIIGGGGGGGGGTTPKSKSTKLISSKDEIVVDVDGKKVTVPAGTTVGELKDALTVENGGSLKIFNVVEIAKFTHGTGDKPENPDFSIPLLSEDMFDETELLKVANIKINWSGKSDYINAPLEFHGLNGPAKEEVGKGDDKSYTQTKHEGNLDNFRVWEEDITGYYSEGVSNPSLKISFWYVDANTDMEITSIVFEDAEGNVLKKLEASEAEVTDSAVVVTESMTIEATAQDGTTKAIYAIEVKEAELPEEPEATAISVEIVGGKAVATVTDQFDEVMEGVTVNFTSENPEVAVLSGSAITAADGKATSDAIEDISVGEATIVATIDETEISDEVTYEVEAVITTVTLVVAQNKETATATVKDQFGKPVNGATVAFTSSLATVATIEASKLTNTSGQAIAAITKKGAGTTSLTATAGGKTSEAVSYTNPAAEVTVVTLVLDGKTATATVKDQYGNPMEGVDVSFNSDDEDVATIAADGNGKTNASGIATATITDVGGEGETANITATAGGEESESVEYKIPEPIYTVHIEKLTPGDFVDSIVVKKNGEKISTSGRVLLWNESASKWAQTQLADGAFAVSDLNNVYAKKGNTYIFVNEAVWSGNINQLVGAANTGGFSYEPTDSGLYKGIVE